MHLVILLVAICVFLPVYGAIALATQTPSANTSTMTSTSSPTPTSTMLPGYTYNSCTGSYYKLHKSFETWHVANSTCAGEGAHLVVLDDREEAKIVAGLVHTLVWVGLRDSRPGGVRDWRTVQGGVVSEVYHRWARGQPLDDAAWACAYLDPQDERLYVLICDYLMYFVCEYEYTQHVDVQGNESTTHKNK